MNQHTNIEYKLPDFESMIVSEPSDKESCSIIPNGNTKDDINCRERIIRDFYRRWKEQHPEQKMLNIHLKDYINVRMISIVETSEHAAKSYLSTLAILQLGIRRSDKEKIQYCITAMDTM